MLEGNKLGGLAGLTDIVNDLGYVIVARISMAGPWHTHGHLRFVLAVIITGPVDGDDMSIFR